MLRLRRPPRRPARSSRLRAALAGTVAAVSSLGLLTGLVAGAAPAQAAGRTYYATPSANLHLVFQSLRAGDTLRLAPGTYRTGYLRPRVASGTAAAPIIVVAADRSRPPLILGGIHLASANYWQLWWIRAQATVKDKSALYMDGGVGWAVRGGEYFGARATGSYANVVIAGGSGYPQGFAFLDNCVHDAAITGRGNTDHNLYVNFHGSPTTRGTIARNTIWGHPDGVGIKLGNGGLYGAPGPWGVRVEQNTIADGGRQVLFHGDVRNNLVRGNILALSREPFTQDPRTTSVYVHDVVGTGNVMDHNYVWAASMIAYDPARRLTYGRGNTMQPDPLFRDIRTCTGWRNTRPTSAPFGRYGTGGF